MRALLLKSAAVAALAIAPAIALAQGPGGGAGPAAGGAERGSAAPAAGGERGGAGPAGGGERGGAGPAAAGERNGAGGEQTKGEGGSRAGKQDADQMKSEKADKNTKGEKADKDMKGENGRPDKEQAGGRAGEAGEKGERAGREDGGSKTEVTSEQRTKVRSAFRDVGGGERIDHVDFSISVGVAVPERYHYRPLPPTVIEIVPQYRGYDFIEVGEQILIINPRTRRIVYVLS